MVGTRVENALGYFRTIGVELGVGVSAHNPMELVGRGDELRSTCCLYFRGAGARPSRMSQRCWLESAATVQGIAPLPSAGH
jgi:hypothetical protein